MKKKDNNKKTSSKSEIEDLFKRYTGVLVEEFQDRIKVIGEQFSGVSEKVDNIAMDMAKVQSDIRDIKFDVKFGLKDKVDRRHFVDLDTRVRRLEKKQT